MNPSAAQKGRRLTFDSVMTVEQFEMLRELLRLQARNFKLLFEAQAGHHRALETSLSAVTTQIRIQGEIPAQVLLQQPMIFRDALDRVTPVHLEFIDSPQVINRQIMTSQGSTC
jgi:hypothetical protein